jgi:hypothetical protein
MNSKSPLIPNPCPESWDRLKPEEQGHFCESCQTKVWDLSAMTEDEAQALLANPPAGDFCVSYRERRDGGVAHRPPPVVPANRLMRRLPAAAGLSLALAACTPTSAGGDKQPVDEKQPTAAQPEAPVVEPEPADSNRVGPPIRKGKPAVRDDEDEEGEVWKGEPKPLADETKPAPETEATKPEPEPEPKKGKVAPMPKKGKVADPF